MPTCPAGLDDLQHVHRRVHLGDLPGGRRGHQAHRGLCHRLLPRQRCRRRRRCRPGALPHPPTDHIGGAHGMASAPCSEVRLRCLKIQQASFWKSGSWTPPPLIPKRTSVPVSVPQRSSNLASPPTASTEGDPRFLGQVVFGARPTVHLEWVPCFLSIQSATKVDAHLDPAMGTAQGGCGSTGTSCPQCRWPLPRPRVSALSCPPPPPC